MSSNTLRPLWTNFSYKHHQLSGIEWMLNRESLHEFAGGLLCDEMGLGKTMEILGTVVNSDIQDTLLICPKAVITQWTTASRKAGLNVFHVESDSWVAHGHTNDNAKSIFITNYEKMDKRPSLFARTWPRAVFDEAHRVSNRNGTKWKVVDEMKREITWLVTATPVVNDLKDIRNLLMLVGYQKEKLTSYNYLKEVIAEACLHRSMDEMRHILHELPNAPVIKTEHLDFMTEEEAAFYRGIQGKIMRRFKQLAKDQITEMFVLIMRLRQLSLHPQVYISARKREVGGYMRQDWDEPSTKFIALREKLEAQAAPTRYIVFCQFHDEMDMLQAYLEDSPAVSRVQQYHGGLTEAMKQETIESTFEDLDDGHDILLVQLHSGGVGLNLQHFTKVVFMSPWWTAALMDQAVGRAVRMGQKETVEVTHFVLKEEETMNIDRRMLDKADTKRDILKGILLHAHRGGVEPPALPSETDAVPILMTEAEAQQREQEQTNILTSSTMPSQTDDDGFQRIPSCDDDPLPLASANA